MNGHSPKLYAALIAATLTAFTGAAQAFTIENGGSGNGGSNNYAPSPFNDPDKKFDTDKSGSANTIQSGNTTIRFGNGQMDADRNYQQGIDRMFSPLGRPGN